MILEKINNSYLYYNDKYLFYVREWYEYCVCLIKNWLKNINNKETRINIIIGDYFAIFPNNNKIFKIDIQYEHTLVKEGGRNSANSLKGNIKTDDNDFYLIRLPKYYKSCDYVIDYSIPNFKNIISHSFYRKFCETLIVISPVMYSFDKLVLNRIRNKNIVTTFINELEPRQNIFFKKLKEMGIYSENITNKYSSEEVKSVYLDTKILVNIHQTAYHQTFEELRVLPALLCGCLVVSENVPLKESIPYHQYVIWDDYYSIVDTIKEVSTNYEYYFKKIFTEQNFDEIVNSLQEANSHNINKMFFDLTSKSKGRNMFKDFFLLIRKNIKNYFNK